MVQNLINRGVIVKSMSRKLILISFILALLAAASAFVYLQSLNAPKGVLKKSTILVAAQTIPQGTLIDKKMIKELQVLDSSIFSDYIKDTTKIIGKYTKETIYSNEGFRSDRLLSEGGDELSLRIDSNHRAISINATGESGVSELLKPGDYVDIIVYLTEKKDASNVINTDLAKMILQNIKVLAVDKELSREDNTKSSEKDKGKTASTFLVTLSVPTDALEKLVLAEGVGSIKLALRPIKDDGTVNSKGTLYKDLIVNMDSANEETAAFEGNSTSYIVRQGDTLKKISQNFYGDPNKYGQIKEANNIQNEDLVLTGEVLKIPVQN
jgi:pilus assembly protein CpaB